VRLLIDQLEGGPARQELLAFPEPEIVPRGSTSPPRST
jgi:hypothetical protein